MKGITRAKFARLANVTQAAVTKAIAAQRLRVKKIGDEKLIDLEDDLAQEFLNSQRQRDARHKAATMETVISGGGTGREVHVPGGERIQLEKARLFQQIETLEQENKLKRGELIERGLVARAFAKLYSIDSTELRFLGHKLGPGLAALAGVEKEDVILKITEAVDNEVMKSLGHIKKQMNAFLESIAAEMIR